MAITLRSIGVAVTSLAVLLSSQTRAQDADRPLPDIPTLMHEVETHQRASETIQKDYLYHEVATEHESDGHGGLKKMRPPNTTSFGSTECRSTS